MLNCRIDYFVNVYFFRYFSKKNDLTSLKCFSIDSVYVKVNINIHPRGGKTCKAFHYSVVKLIYYVYFRLACGIISRSAGLFENTKKICACDGVTLWEERNRPLAGPNRRQQPSSQL